MPKRKLFVCVCQLCLQSTCTSSPEHLPESSSYTNKRSSVFVGNKNQVGQISRLPYARNYLFNPLPDDKFKTSELKNFADHNFKFDENGRKLSKTVENTGRKGEIACYEQFLLFPSCFQKACFPGASKDIIVWEWVNFM